MESRHEINRECGLIKRITGRMLRDPNALPLGLALLSFDIRFLDLEKDIQVFRAGETIYVNSQSHFLQKRDFEGALTFLLLHEICHVLFFHDKRGAGKDPDLWTLATDYMINGLLDDLRPVFDRELIPYRPRYIFNGQEPAPFNPEFKNHLEEEIYRELLKSADVEVSPPQRLSGLEEAELEGGSRRFSGMPRFVKSRIRHKKQMVNQKRAEMPPGDEGNQKGEGDFNREDEDESQGIKDEAKGRSRVLPDPDRQDMTNAPADLDIIRHLFRDVLKGHGSRQAQIALAVLSGHTTDWQAILRDSLSLALDRSPEITWGRPRTSWLLNAGKIPYLPGPVDDFVPGTIIISIDESASISDADLSKVLAAVEEVKGRYKRVLVIKHDTAINFMHEYEEVGSGELRELSIRYSHGGTSHAEVFRQIADYTRRSEIPASIYLGITDLESDIPACQGDLPPWLPRIFLTTGSTIPEGITGRVINILCKRSQGTESAASATT